MNSILNNPINSFHYYPMALDFININQNLHFLFHFIRYYYKSIHLNNHLIILMKLFYFVIHQSQNYQNFIIINYFHFDNYFQRVLKNNYHNLNQIYPYFGLLIINFLFNS